MSVLKAVCIISVLLILVVIAANRFGNITFSSISDYADTVISGTKRGDGYPYYFENTGVRNVLSRICLLLGTTPHFHWMQPHGGSGSSSTHCLLP